MKELILMGLFIMSTHSAALAVDKSLSPLQEWAMPKSVIMGGISDCTNIAPYYAEYMKYMETLSKAVPLTYFTNLSCSAYIKSHIDTSNIQFVDYSLNSIWMRDYAPIWLQSKNDGSFALANFPYGANYFGKHEQDDQFSSFLSQTLQIPLVLDFPRKQPQFYFDGGNLLVDEDHNCYTSSLIFPRKNGLEKVNLRALNFRILPDSNIQVPSADADGCTTFLSIRKSPA